MGVNKIIHIADVHIRLYKRHEEYRRVFDQFFDEIRDTDVDRIVIAGDIVHSKNQMTPELISMVTYLLGGCAKIAKTIIIPGNHDLLVNNLDRLDALTPIIDAMDNDNIVYYKDTGCFVDDNVVWCVYSQLDGNVRPQIEMAKIKNGEHRKYIGLYHDPIAGLITDVGFEFLDSTTVDIFDGLDFTLCGDIHRRQVLYNGDGRPVIQVGSMVQQGFGETVTNHGYCIVELDVDKFSFKNLDNSTGFYTFELSSLEDIETGDERILNYD